MTASILPISNEKHLRILVTVLTVTSLTLTIWNVYQQHKYRKLEYQLHLKDVESHSKK